MVIRCNSCDQEYDDTLDFCPFCGQLKDSDENTNPFQFNIFDKITEENVNEFSPLNEPTTEYEAFKKAINDSYDRYDRTGTEVDFTDYSDKYIEQNQHYNDTPDIDTAFRRHYEDNDLNKNGIAAVRYSKQEPHKTNIPVQKKAPVKSSSTNYSNTDILHIAVELAPLLFSIILTFSAMAFSLDCKMKMSFIILPYFLIALMINSYAAITKYFSIFDKITIPILLMLTVYFGYHTGTENKIPEAFIVVFICFGVQILCSLFSKRILSSDNIIDTICKIAVLISSVIPLCLFIKTSLKDSEMLLLLTFVLFSIVNITEMLYESFGFAILIITVFPAVSELFLLKTELNKMIDPNISTMIMLIIFVAPTVIYSLNYKNKKGKPFEISVINILSFIIIHVLLLIIYLCLSAGINKQYITLADELFNFESIFFALLIIAGNCIYPALSYLVKRTK